MKTILKAALALAMLVGTPVAIRTLLQPAVLAPSPASVSELAILPLPSPASASAVSDIVLVVDGVEIKDPARKAALLSEARNEVRELLETAGPIACPADRQADPL